LRDCHWKIAEWALSFLQKCKRLPHRPAIPNL